MSVIFKEESGRGRSATNDKGARTYSRTFLLEATSQSDGPYAVGSNASLPKIGSPHPEDSDAYCVRLRIDNSNPWKGWTAIAEYSDERVITENPLDDGVQIDWGSEQFQRPAVFDINGSAIVNSAGDPFDPQLMMDDSRRVVTVEANLPFVPTWILDYQDAVNSDTFNIDGIIVAAGCAKIQSVTVGPVKRRNGIAYRIVRLVIHLQRDGWLLASQDIGFREIAYGGVQNIKNPVDEELPGAPVPLDGAGVSQSNPTAASGVILSFTVYKTRAFASLPLS
jgi:hypothetical protein